MDSKGNSVADTLAKEGCALLQRDTDSSSTSSSTKSSVSTSSVTPSSSTDSFVSVTTTTSSESSSGQSSTVSTSDSARFVIFPDSIYSELMCQMAHSLKGYCNIISLKRCGKWCFNNLSSSHHQTQVNSCFQVNSCCQANVLSPVCINWFVSFAVMLLAVRLKWQKSVMSDRFWFVGKVRSFCQVHL